jgi:hypothetical protein
MFLVTCCLHLQDRNCSLYSTAGGRLLQTLATETHCVASQITVYITATTARTSNFKSFIRHQDKYEYLFIDCKFQYYLSSFPCLLPTFKGIQATTRSRAHLLLLLLLLLHHLLLLLHKFIVAQLEKKFLHLLWNPKFVRFEFLIVVNIFRCHSQ